MMTFMQTRTTHAFDLSRADYANLKAWGGGIAARAVRELIRAEAVRRGEMEPPVVVVPIDSIEGWLSDRCEQVDGYRQNRVDAYRDYKRWCGEHDLVREFDRPFYETLKQRGYQAGRSSGMRYHVGLKLKPKESSGWNYNED